MNRIILMLLIAATPILTYAQQGEKVKCIIVDAKTYKPIKYAVATVGNVRDTTGRKGTFIMYMHEPRKVQLEAEGYETTEVTVQPGAGKNKQYLKMYQERRRHEILN